jgi:general secretion pathway protein J
MGPPCIGLRASQQPRFRCWDSIDWERFTRKAGDLVTGAINAVASKRASALGMRSEMLSSGVRARARVGNEQGFTLVELLIALALVSLITLMLFSGLRLGSRAWEGVDAVSERVSEVRVARDFLMSTLSQARPTSVMLDAEMIFAFAGDRERLEFVAPLSEHVGMPGLYILRLGLVPSGEDQTLMLTRWLIHPEVLEGLDDTPAWEPLEADSGLFLEAVPRDTDAAAGAFGHTVLLDRVAEFEIAYFGTLDGEIEPDWHEEWLGQSNLPDLLQIRMATPAQSWPDLMVSLAAPVY